MNSNSMKEFLKQSGGSTATNVEKVKEAIQQGDVSKIASSMSKEDMNKVQAILSDKEQMEKILQSSLAKTLLKQLGK